MTPSETHTHVFTRTSLMHADGTPIPGGRRCSCGMEVVGEGLYSLNANLVRASYNFNRAAARAMEDIGKRMVESRRRMFP